MISPVVIKPPLVVPLIEIFLLSQQFPLTHLVCLGFSYLGDVVAFPLTLSPAIQGEDPAMSGRNRRGRPCRREAEEAPGRSGSREKPLGRRPPGLQVAMRLKELKTKVLAVA